jgi:hypothetical protein
VARLIVLVQRPYHLSEEEAERWLRSQAEELARSAEVRRVDVTRLASVSLRFGREWDWLLELYLERGEDAQRAVREPACAGLLADLRVLGMKPSVAVVERTVTVAGPD